MWKVEMVEILRVMLDDLDEEAYSEDTLLRLLSTAAFGVNRELGLGYTVKVTAQSITPDPCADPRDDAFADLVCLKAACTVERSATRKAAGKGYLVRDGGTTVDGRERARHHLDLLKVNWCKAYQDGKADFFVARSAGVAVMGPIRLYAREWFHYHRDDDSALTQLF